ncbi:MAG TPA: ribosomal protein S18-alanine N-acetyltransferase [Anaerolineae bacterium]|nr:ribosomal protein S18-alanine N-acetyltransferase [Anaerolineae bacterium]
MIELAPPRLAHPKTGIVPYQVEPMQWSDVPDVMVIERQSFTLPWSDYTYQHEILENNHSHYYVVRHANGQASERPNWLTRLFRRPRPAPVVGYGGFWLVLDESHISTIASSEQWRGRGIGELMLLAMVERSIELGAVMVTLEVRVSNTVAHNLYRKYGFEVVGRRPRYYRDNDEDADLMTVDHIQDAAYKETLRALRAALEEHLRNGVPRSNS